MYVHTDVTAVFPWITYALLSDPAMRRTPGRLYSARKQAVENLQLAVDKNRRELLKTIDYPLPKAAKKKR
jgi:deoxyhypusine synthase